MEKEKITEYIERIEEELKVSEPKQVIQAHKYDEELESPALVYEFINKFKRLLDAELLLKLEHIVASKCDLELAVEYAINNKLQNASYELEVRLIESNEPRLIYLYLIKCETPYQKELEEALRKTNSAEYNCKYAQHLLNKEQAKDTKKYAQIVIKSEEVRWIYELAYSTIKKNNNSDISEYEKRIIELNNYNYIFKIMNLTRGQNIKQYNELLKSEDSELIYGILRIIDQNNIKNLVELYEERLIKLNSLEYIYACAKNFKTINIDKFTKKIIEVNNLELMIKYAREILNKRNKSISDIQDIIIKSKNTEIIIKFANQIKGADIEKCFDPIYKSKSIEMMCEFVRLTDMNEMKLSEIILAEEEKNAYWSLGFIRNFPGINFEQHRKIILESKDPRWNYEFVRSFPNTFTKEHEEVIISSKNEKYIELFSQLPGSTIKIEPKQKQPRVKQKKPKKISKMTEEEALEALEMYLLVENIENIFKCAAKCKISNEVLSERIKEKSSARLSTGFICKCPAIDFEEHRRIILESEDAECNYLFIKYFKDKGVDIEEHKQIVQSSSQTYWIEQLNELLGKIMAKKR